MRWPRGIHPRYGRAAAAAVPVLAVAIVLTIALPGAPPQAQNPRGTVTVDFGRRLPARSLVGFLHGLDRLAPSSRWIDPLRPALWRGDLFSASYERATASGARYMLVMSDLWGYPGERESWRGRRPPWTDLAAWRSFVLDLARTNRGRDVVWEVWNEPDNRYFWTGTRADYLATYAVAYAAIRSVLGPQARLAGPSVSWFSWRWLADLVRYCRRTGCEVNTLTWHELGYADSPISAVSAHLRRARARLVADPANAGVRIRELVVAESVGATDQLQPAEQSAFLYHMERGGADGAARACWRDPCGEDNCTNRSLDGLLDPRTQQPRATWWVVRTYAQGVGGRVWSRSDSAWLISLATRRGAGSGRAEILLGYFDPHSVAVPGQLEVHIRLRGLTAVPGLARARSVLVSMDRIPDAGESPAAPSSCAAPRVIPVRAGTAMLTTPALRLHEAMVLILSPAPG